MGERLKIIPMLIVVAMLAFSVRLVDVVTGMRDLSGAALAAAEESSQSEPVHDIQAGQPEASEEVEDEAEIAMKDAEEPGGVEDETLQFDDAESIDWKDASDSDVDVSAVKMEMFEDLQARRKNLEKRERMLVTREALLRAAEQELDRKYQEMAALRKEIESLLEQQSEEEKARIDSLVKVYEGMKAKDAARIFDTLDIDVLVNVISKMSERKIAPILAAMNPERARSVTILLAEQKSLPELPQN